MRPNSSQRCWDEPARLSYAHVALLALEICGFHANLEFFPNELGRMLSLLAITLGLAILAIPAFPGPMRWHLCLALMPLEFLALCQIAMIYYGVGPNITVIVECAASATGLAVLHCGAAPLCRSGNR